MIFPILLLLISAASLSSVQAAAPTANSKLFREYIGAEDTGVTFSDVPINTKVEFHFILSFAIDYKSSSSLPSDGHFKAYWDKKNLNPSNVSSIKTLHSNVKVAMSLGGDTFKDGQFVNFTVPKSIETWVKNAVHSITKIARKYNLDGIDIDYEHFNADPETFAECIGSLLLQLKHQQVGSKGG